MLVNPIIATPAYPSAAAEAVLKLEDWGEAPQVVAQEPAPASSGGGGMVIALVGLVAFAALTVVVVVHAKAEGRIQDKAIAARRNQFFAETAARREAVRRRLGGP